MRRAVALAACLGVLAVLVGVAFAGSSARLADGTSIDGVDVGGMAATEAVAVLSTRAAAHASEPIAIVAGGREFDVAPSQLGVEADWRGAVAAAVAASDGFRPVRGFKRLYIRLFGTNVAPSAAVYRAALDYKLDEIEDAVAVAPVDAALKLDGLRVSVVPGRAGRQLDRVAAESVLVRSLASLAPPPRVALPVAIRSPAVTAPMLRRAREQMRVALSTPVKLTDGTSSWRISRARIASLLQLPSGGTSEASIGGAGAESWAERLAARVDRPARDARFALNSQGHMTIVPSHEGRLLDVPATIEALSVAVFSPEARVAKAVVRAEAPQRTTAQAKAMGITGVVSSYTTSYGGTEGRVHNVQLVADLIDGTLIGPGATFSFNGTTGERNAEKGFEEAPVIVNGELQNGIGGGVCQVSTTVFNAVFEAGLPVEQRNNHALYISHYPLGRDATVNYPDLDLKFSNDTGHWLLLRTFVGAGSLTVNLYGTPTGRRVVSETSPLTVSGEQPVETIDDPTLKKGKRVIDELGAPPRQTSVSRTVYGANGDVLYEDSWASSYVAETRVVRVGTKEPPPKPAKKPVQSPGADEPVPGKAVPPQPVTPAGSQQ